jgi:outer membrane protein OmpA-like peptidoglycan-associated protein
VNYTKGDVVSARGTGVTVDVSGPELSFNSRPEFFSPDNDGVDDELIISLSAQDASPIAGWSLEIREPEPPYLVFYRIEGRGSPAERIIWDGRSSKGELVQSAMDYPYTFKAEDILGNASSTEGKIGVDVLVIRDGDRLKIQVPAIVFTPNTASLDGNNPADKANNEKVLRRIAEILNKFRDYKVQVEGHANPVAGTEAEEKGELKPLSEKRAQAVVDWLARNGGVARSRLFSIGMGGTRTVVPYTDMDNRWKNRRVVFILIK